jgi:hypothetical protein
MADYHPLISRAVEGLSNNTAEARRTLYERARAALVGQLRGIDPPLSEAEITRERLALEDAIRKVEAESVRKARSEPRPAAPRSINATSRPYDSAGAPPIPAPPAWRDSPSAPLGNMSATPRSEPRFADPAGKDTSSGRANEPFSGEPLRGEPQTSARSQLLSARSPQRQREEFKGFRNLRGTQNLDASAGTAKASREAHNAYSTAPHQFSDPDEESWRDGEDARFDDEQPADVLEDAPPVHEFEQGYDFDDHRQIGPASPQPHRPIAPAARYRQSRPPRSYRDFVKLAIVLIIPIALGVLVSWQWSNINGLYQFLSHLRSRPTQTAQAPQGEPKFGGRVPQQDQARQPSSPAASPNSQGGPAVAQRVVLYEEDPSNPQGKQLVGSAVWRTETVSPGSGLAPELQVRADVTVPERNMTVTWTLRRNTDQALPASHTIEIMFNLPADFPGGGIANVPGVLMKESEQARGVPLAGLAVKVTNGFFLIGLSAVDADVQRNLQLLKDRPWFDVPIVYDNGGRAILALEKGPSGERAFADAFAAWSK